jgi:hypothetical protein
MGTESASPLARLRQLGPQWAAVSSNAFAGMAESPERYAAAARLVGAWLDRLRGAAPAVDGADAAECDEDHDEGAQAVAAALLGAWDERESADVAAGLTLPLTATERDALTAAAFAIRYGEVTGWLAARRRRQSMARATAQTGRTRSDWLVLDEAGDPAGDPFIAYRRLEVDPVTGSGVLVETRPDDDFTGVVHVVQLVSVDPASGELTADNSSKYWEFGSATEREERVSALRSSLAR